MTSRANELPYTEGDWRELVVRLGAVKRLARTWRRRRLDPDTFRAYLREMASATECLFQWMDELWLYGTGGRQAFDAEIEAEDAADPAALSSTQVKRRQNRVKWAGAAALASRLATEARAAGDPNEAQRFARAFVRNVIPWLPRELQDKEILLDRAILSAMLRGDRPETLTAVSLDDYPEFADPDRFPRVVPGDDPLEFPPATASCHRIGLFAESLHLRDNLNGRLYLRIEAPDADTFTRAECRPL